MRKNHYSFVGSCLVSVWSTQKEHINNHMVRGDAVGEAELEQVQRKLDQNIEHRCCDTKGAGQKRFVMEKGFH